MELTHKHKLLLGVVGVGAIALMVDRLVLGSSAPASASAAPVVQASAPKQQAQVAAQVQEGSADRLQRLAGALPVPTPENEAAVAGAFTAPVHWLPEAQRKVAAETRSVAGHQSELADRFRLTSVFTIGPGYATINGKKVAVGTVNEELGVKLLAIEPPVLGRAAGAVVEYRGQQVRLSTGYSDAQHGGDARR